MPHALKMNAIFKYTILWSTLCSSKSQLGHSESIFLSFFVEGCFYFFEKKACRASKTEARNITNFGDEKIDFFNIYMRQPFEFTYPNNQSNSNMPHVSFYLHVRMWRGPRLQVRKFEMKVKVQKVYMNIVGELIFEILSPILMGLKRFGTPL